MPIIRTYSLWATLVALCDGYDFFAEDDEAMSLLQMRANTNKTMKEEREASASRDWWRDQGCKTELGDDIAKCRLKTDVHVPERWGGPGGLDNHQRGFRLAATTVDSSLTAHVFQCPFDGSPSTSQVSGLAMRMGDHIIECLRPPEANGECHQYIYCKVDGEDISFSSFPRTWPSGLYIERGSHYHLCIDAPGGRASVNIAFRFNSPPRCDIMTRLAWFEMDLKIQRDLVRTNDRSLCGADSADSEQLTCEDSLFSAQACTDLCTGCHWNGNSEQTCENLPDPDAVPPSQELCEESGCSYGHAQEVCGPLRSNANAYEGCLLDVCSECQSEEGQDQIAQDDIEDEELSNPGPACVDEADCGLPANTCSESVKLNTASVSHNNFAGAGPDSGAEEIRYSNAAAVDGRVIDLVVKKVGGSYLGDSAKNGNKGRFGRINLNSQKSVEMEFSFVDSATSEPVTLDATALSFFDLDEGKNGKSRTTITACGARNAILTTNTELAVTRPNDCYAVSSTLHGTGANNPTSLTQLTPGQVGRSVTFDFASVSSIRITLAISNGWGKRNTLWSFDPALSCLDGSDPNMPLNPPAPVDPNAPSEEVCPVFTLGDGKGHEFSENECGFPMDASNTHTDCVEACRQNCPGINGVSSGNGIANPTAFPCWCERNQIATNDRGDVLNFFCPPWKPLCNFDLWKECKAALIARGGLAGVEISSD